MIGSGGFAILDEVGGCRKVEAVTTIGLDCTHAKELSFTRSLRVLMKDEYQADPD